MSILDQQVDPNYGLLGPVPNQGLLSPGMPLMALGAGLLQAGAPSTDPGAFQRGIGGAIGGYLNAQQMQQQNALRQRAAQVELLKAQQEQEALNRQQQQQWATAQAFREMAGARQAAGEGNEDLAVTRADAAQDLLAGDPRFQKAAIDAQFATPKTPTTKRAIDPTTGQLVYATEADIQQRGLTPPPPQPLVSLSNTEETAESKKVGGFYGEQFTTLQKAGMSARAQNNRLDQLGALLDQVETGAGAQALLGLKRWGRRFGIEMGDDIGPAEAAQALSAEMALELRNPAGGAGMPGAMSDRDREFLESMVPGLGQTKEGRRLLIEARKKLNQRDIEVAKLAREYRKQKGQLDEDFETFLAERLGNNPSKDLFASERGQFVEAPSSTGRPGRYDPSMSTPDLLDYLNIPHDLRNQ